MLGAGGTGPSGIRTATGETPIAPGTAAQARRERGTAGGILNNTTLPRNGVRKRGDYFHAAGRQIKLPWVPTGIASGIKLGQTPCVSMNSTQTTLNDDLSHLTPAYLSPFLLRGLVPVCILFKSNKFKFPEAGQMKRLHRSIPVPARPDLDRRRRQAPSERLSPLPQGMPQPSSSCHR